MQTIEIPLVVAVVLFLLLLVTREVEGSENGPFVPYSMVTLDPPNDGTVNAYDAFGASVAIKGDGIAVGADTAGTDGQGLVAIFAHDGLAWGLSQSVSAPDGKHGDRFGNAVTIYDEWLMVGAFLYNRSGKVYVFRNQIVDYETTERSWLAHKEIVPYTPTIDGFFGHRLVSKNYTLMVAHPGAKVEQLQRSGNVMVYNNFGLEWVLGNIITPRIPSADTLHGFSLDFDRGDTVITGAPLHRGGGRAYVFQNDDGTRWDETVQVNASSSSESESTFGDAVAISDDGIVVVSSTSGGPINNQGFVQTLVNGTLDAEILFGDSDSKEGAHAEGRSYFGQALAIRNDILVVGAPFEDGKGAVYVYKREVGRWRLYFKLLGPDPDASSNGYSPMFGWSLHLSEDNVLVVGAPGSATSDGRKKTGAAFVYSHFDFSQGPFTQEPSPSPTAHPSFVAATNSPSAAPCGTETPEFVTGQPTAVKTSDFSRLVPRFHAFATLAATLTLQLVLRIT